MSLSNPKIDVEYPDVTTKILTFGSCHNNKLLKPGQPIIWDAISALKPDAFLWTGDTIYSSIKSGISSPALLQEQYAQMTNNKTIGYSTFLSKGEVDGYLKGGVHGTWDDHDYGANDSGMQMPNRKERQNLLLDFWGVDEKDERRERNGIYSSVTFGTAPQKVKVVFMDTRSARSRHCIPSVGALPIPMASAFACVTRWITAGLNLQKFIPRCKNGKILDDAQWTWLEEQMLGTDAQVNILVSSIQVLSSNPMMETWGQFPSERDRLLSILNNVEEGKSVVVLSGDVHHAEILDSSTGVSRSSGRTIEVTSSGLTHSCKDPFYGFLCERILKRWSEHRYKKGIESNYYTGTNFGSIEIDWADQSDERGNEMKISVHDNLGNPVITTGSLPFWSYESHFSKWQIQRVLGPVDGHMIPMAIRIGFALFLLVVSKVLRKFLFQKAFKKITESNKEKKD